MKELILKHGTKPKNPNNLKIDEQKLDQSIYTRSKILTMQKGNTYGIFHKHLSIY